jgi:hypothetical protein
MNSHVGSWSPEWSPESLERDCKGQNSLLRRVFYIIEKLLKRRCLKWARIAHLTQVMDKRKVRSQTKN